MMDDAGTEHDDGWVLIATGCVAAVGGGASADADERVDLGGAVVTPGLVNTHHHLYQTLTRARAQQADLFTWLRELYPGLGRHRRGVRLRGRAHGARRARALGLHDGLRPPLRLPARHERADRGRGARGARARRAHRRVARLDGPRRVATAACRPTRSSRSIDDVLADTERLAGLQDDDGMVQIAVAPCSPFSVTGRLMRESAELARRLGLKLHTHLAETVEEEEYCRELYGCRPVEYLSELGWIDVGRVVRALRPPERRRHPDLRPTAASASRTARRRTCGSAPASRRVRELLDAGVRVGLGVDGSASNERGDLLFEVKQALLVARARGGPAAMTAREALRLGTRGGAAVLGRDDIGSLEPGKRADIAVWRTDTLEMAGRRGPGPGLVLSAPHRVDRLYVGGEEVVRDGRLVHADEDGDRAAPSGPGAKIRSCDLDPRPRHRARGPAAGVRVELFRGDELVASRETDADGRVRELADVEPGVYRLVFHPPSPFFRRVELELELDDGDYHVPLLVSPFGCATYRGS